MIRCDRSDSAYMLIRRNEPEFVGLRMQDVSAARQVTSRISRVICMSKRFSYTEIEFGAFLAGGDVRGQSDAVFL